MIFRNIDWKVVGGYFDRVHSTNNWLRCMIPLPWVFCEYLFLGENSDTSTKLTKILTLTNRNCLTCELFFWRSQSTEKRGCLCLMKGSSETLQKYLKSKQMFCAAAELRTFQLGFQKLDMHLKSLHSAAEKVLERGK